MFHRDHRCRRNLSAVGGHRRDLPGRGAVLDVAAERGRWRGTDVGNWYRAVAVREKRARVLRRRGQADRWLPGWLRVSKLDPALRSLTICSSGLSTDLVKKGLALFLRGGMRRAPNVRFNAERSAFSRPVAAEMPSAFGFSIIGYGTTPAAQSARLGPVPCDDRPTFRPRQ
jgi:hypothetical protein